MIGAERHETKPVRVEQHVCMNETLRANLYTAQEALVDAAEYFERAGVLPWWRAKYAATIRAAWKAVNHE